jgi:aspartyl-tRNA(Asn)/glutamyl-tRNA(Gln) amidotransferase subunit A
MVHAIWSSATAGTHHTDLDQVRDQLDPGRLAVVEEGRLRTASELANAMIRRNAYYLTVRKFMENYDLLLTPTLPCTAFPAGADHPGQIDGHPTTYLSWTAFTYPFNLTGQPAATLPIGFDDDGLPIGLQIVGRWHDDTTVLRASAAFEAIAPWAHIRPPDPTA